ncbi:MAG: hypothetical protein U0271_13340 [Polyangiaceae bacterium]
MTPSRALFAVHLGVLGLFGCERKTASTAPEPPLAATSTSASASSSATTLTPTASASSTVAATLPDTRPTQPVVQQTLDCDNYFGCAVYADSRVGCWGFNQFGQLGVKPVAYPATARAIVPDLPSATAVAAGFTHACALTRDGEVYCWGTSDDGALGDGSPPPASGAPDHTIPPTRVPLDQKAVDLDASITQTCAALADGAVACWGRQVADASDTASSPTPVKVAGVTGAVEVATGESRACSRSAKGDVTCWGRENFEAVAPHLVAGVCARQLALSDDLCFVDCQGGVACVGNHPGSSLNANDRDHVEVIAGFEEVVDLRAGLAHFIARTQAGAVLTWGGNDSGQLGVGKPKSWTDAYSYVPVTVPASWKADAICAGGIIARPSGRPYLRAATFLDTGSSCARTTAGDVYCWGEPNLDYTPKKVSLPR